MTLWAKIRHLHTTQKYQFETFHQEKLSSVWIKPHLFTINVPTNLLTFIHITSKIHVAWFSWLLSSFFQVSTNFRTSIARGWVVDKHLTHPMVANRLLVKFEVGFRSTTSNWFPLWSFVTLQTRKRAVRKSRLVYIAHW